MANLTELKSLFDIFNRNIEFVIPDYQRGYSWGPRQRNDLWEDIANITSGRSHYTGMFTFCVDKDNKNILYVVDGQQRMTTLIILINELLKRIELSVDDYTTVDECIKKYLYTIPLNGLLSSCKYRFQYANGDSSNVFFRKNILGLDITEEDIPNTLYTNNLQAAQQEFAKKIEDKPQYYLRDLFKKVTEQLKFHEYVINDESDVHVTFETMNNRGKGLSTLELLKNRLIYLTTLYSDEELDNISALSLRATINIAWKGIYQYLGKSVSKVFNDDLFLKDHWIMYFRYDRKTAMVFKDDLLSRYFTSSRVYTKELKPKEIENYVFSLQKSIKVWFNINCPNESEIAENEKIWLTRLNRVGIGSFRPLIMAAYLQNNGNIELLLKACERFRFLISSMTERRSNTADNEFYKLAQQYYSSQDPKICNLVDSVNRQTNRWFNFDIFVSTCVDRYKKASGFYSWKGLRYFLFEYERTLQMSSQDKKCKCEWNNFVNNQNDVTSIEHIYPQTPTDPYWIERFVTDNDKALVNSLGNLLLLSIGKNIKVRNFSFEVKKETKYNSDGTISYNGYNNGSYSEHVVANEKEWTPKQIIDRGKILLDFLVDHWEIDRGLLTEKHISQILNKDDDATSTPLIQNSLEDDEVDDYLEEGDVVENQ